MKVKGVPNCSIILECRENANIPTAEAPQMTITHTDGSFQSANHTGSLSCGRCRQEQQVFFCHLMYRHTCCNSVLRPLAVMQGLSFQGNDMFQCMQQWTDGSISWGEIVSLPVITLRNPLDLTLFL